MNAEIREFFEKLIAVINENNNVPIEAKRLALYSAFQLEERQANEVIEIELKEAADAKGILQDQLAELSE